ncbi:ABC transporter B family member 29, chloroplastic-like [Papaver somniferum]|uniref:ABC transporter B family member 29, chloroplastic-like n=1 Tax=Papaver somniferum TaxID=3469 RepID=UPI000E6FA30F|nr:ABC transporter B family member 29, chloroplastic-like [Papaver somniferum]
MAVIRFTPPPLLCPSTSSFKQKPTYLNLHSKTSTIKLISLKTRHTRIHSSFSPVNHSSVNKQKTESRFESLPLTLPSLSPIKPFVQSEWKSIIKGWVCSFISVYCLSKVVPKVGKFSEIFSKIDATRLPKEGLFLGVLVLARLVATYWQQVFLWEAALNSSYKIRVYVYERVLKRNLSFFEGGGGVLTGDVAYRITAEASDIADTVYALLNTIVPSGLQLAAMATQMMKVSPILSLVSALVIPCICIVIGYLGHRLAKISKKAHLTVAKLSAYLNEVLPSMLFIKASNAERCESARFQKLAQADLSEQLKKKRMKAFIPQIVQGVYIGTLLIFCVGSVVVSRGTIDGASMLSFVTSLFLLIEPIQGVGKAYSELKQGEPAIERLFDLTKFSSQVIEKPDAVDLGSVTGDVKFCNVSFKYGENMPFVLDALNLHIKPGETVALVGPSGGGKTTFLKLLLRLYEPLCGSILIDDQNIRSCTLESLRRHVGLVSQDTTLFSGTVAENIGYRDFLGKIDMKKVEHAAKTANADEFIRNLPAGYETNIGQRGSIFSGGQKQRLAIARAIYQDSSILLLDEATSALDSKSELLVRQALERLMENRTVLVIAHRLETVLMADRILLLENGKLEEVSRTSLVSNSNYVSLMASGMVI